MKKISENRYPGKKHEIEETESTLQLALIASEERYRRLFESAKDGILILDAESGKIIDVNPFLIDLLDYSKERFIGKEIWEIGFFKDIAANKEKYAELQQHEYVRYDNLPLESADGRKINVEFVSNVYFANKKRVIQCNIRDITERKHAEESLNESHQLIKGIINAIPARVFWKDRNLVFLGCNKLFALDAGFTDPKDIIGKDDFQMGWKNEAELYREDDRKVIENGKPEFLIEEPQTTPAGNTITLLTSKVPLLNLNGEVNGVLGTYVDITGRKLMEEKLRENEERFRTAAESILDVIYDWDIKEKVDWYGDIDNIMGYLPGKFPRTIEGWSALIHPADKNIVMSALEAHLKCETPYIVEYRIRRNDGEWRWWSARGTALRNEKGEPYKMIGSITDITEYRKSQQNIIFQANLLNNVGQAVIATDLAGKVIYWNHAAEKIYGWSSNEAMGQDIVNLTPAEQGKALAVELMNELREGRTWSGEFMVSRKDGSSFPAYVTDAPILDPTGKLIGIIGISSDITERKLAEKELVEAKNKAEESDRLKSAFLANMSHEIRTPMNGILGFTELLKDPHLTGAEQKEFIRIIEKSGDRMLNLINDIISISKVESGQETIYISDTNVNDTIKEVYNFFKQEAEQKGLKLSFENSRPQMESIIRTDRRKVFAVLSNLVKNAIKFTIQGSIEFGYERKNGFLEFFVKDTGPGVPPAHRDLIFERFRQGSESLTRNYEGAGLGLSISKAYVEMLGGKIWVESNNNEPISAEYCANGGSKFYFTIPIIIHHEKKASEMNETTDHIPANKVITRNTDLKILLAEDDMLSEVLIRILIRSLAKEIIIARTGQEAIELCHDNPDIDLVLMDIKMPGINGYEATRQIRTFNKNVAIIAQTAYAMEGDREMALRAGCDDYITKPLDQALLIKMIKDVLLKRKATPTAARYEMRV